MSYKSQAQRGYFHTDEGKKKIGKKKVREFDKASKGMTDLPYHVKKKKKKSIKEEIMDRANRWLDEDEDIQESIIDSLMAASKGKSEQTVKDTIEKAKGLLVNTPEHKAATNSKIMGQAKQKAQAALDAKVIDKTKALLGISTSQVVGEDSAGAMTTTSIGSPTAVDGSPVQGKNSSLFYAKWPFGEGSPMLKRNTVRKDKKVKKMKSESYVDELLDSFFE